jgi:hypothetical protein
MKNNQIYNNILRNKNIKNYFYSDKTDVVPTIVFDFDKAEWAAFNCDEIFIIHDKDLREMSTEELYEEYDSCFFWNAAEALGLPSTDIGPIINRELKLRRIKCKEEIIRRRDHVKNIDDLKEILLSNGYVEFSIKNSNEMCFRKKINDEYYGYFYSNYSVLEHDSESYVSMLSKNFIPDNEATFVLFKKPNNSSTNLIFSCGKKQKFKYTLNWKEELQNFLENVICDIEFPLCFNCGNAMVQDDVYDRKSKGWSPFWVCHNKKTCKKKIPVENDIVLVYNPFENLKAHA